MANTLYTAGQHHIVDNGFSGIDIRVLLVDSAGAYTVDKDHDRLDDITAAELSTTNYVRKSLTSESVAIDNTNDLVKYDGDDVTWTSLGPVSGGPTIQAGVVYIHIDGTDANDIPWLYIDTGGFPYDTNSGDFDILWNSSGIATEAQA